MKLNHFRKLLLLFFLMPTGFIYSAETEIVGNVPSYAHSELIFYTSSDPVTKKPEFLASTRADKNGFFTLRFRLDSVKQAFVDLGIFRGTIYLEPGKTYKISFPEKKEKSKAETLNPFFEPMEFHIPIENLSPDDLNFKIVAFNNTYFPYLDKFTLNLRTGTKKTVFDSAVVVLQNITKDSGAFFHNFVKYRIGYLKHLAYQQRSKSISKEYFQTLPVLYNNPAYLDLFNQVYNRYFYFFGRSTYGKKIFDDINVSGSYWQMTSTLMKDSVLQSDTLRELVILKNIHDEFYAANFSRPRLLQILDSLSAITRVPQNRTIAINIREKITRLMPGYLPPQFEMKDHTGKMRKLSDFSGSYVYMCFCTSSSYSCLKEFDALQKMHDKYKGMKLVILTLSNDDNWEAMADFVKKSGYSWEFLFCGDQPEVLAKYDIRAYPTYFLIGPDGKLIYSPAVSPAEGFELKLFQVMRNNGDI